MGRILTMSDARCGSVFPAGRGWADHGRTLRIESELGKGSAVMKANCTER